MPGLHPVLVRFAGFEGFTVPALEVDGRKVQGSRPIARFLDEIAPEPPLFPREPGRARRVEEAERWGEQVLQPVPRRLFRQLLLTDEDARLWMGTEVMRLPAVSWRALSSCRDPPTGAQSRTPTTPECAPTSTGCRSCSTAWTR